MRRVVGLKRAPDLRIAFIAALDDPDEATSPEDLYTLATPGGLKISCLHGDDCLSFGANVLEHPLQVPVMINTNNDRVDIG